MDKKKLNKILESSIRAPSGDNLQNWRIKLKKDGSGFILGFGDFKKDFFDVDGIASIFSCGCLLKNIEIAARNYGYNTQINILNENSNMNVAEVTFFEGEVSSDLYKEIGKRFTSRVPFKKRSLSKKFYQEINNSVKSYEGVENIFLKRSNKSYEEIENILYEVESIRMSNGAANKFTESTIRYSEEEVLRTRDGLDYRLLGIPVFQRLLSKLVFNSKFVWLLRKFRIKFPAYISSKRLLKKSAGIGCIFIKDESWESFVKAGMFFQELWLVLTKNKGSLQPFAAMPIFNLKIENKDIEGIDKKDIAKLKKLKSRFFSTLKLGRTKKLFMIYRYGKFKKKPRIFSERKKLKYFLLTNNS